MTTFTATDLENTLGKASHAPISRLNKTDLTPQQKQEVNALENITSFGQDSISLFDNQVYEMKGLPTQEQYCTAGVELMITWIKENRPDILITPVLREACKLRLTRTYMSKCIELHLEAVIKEHLPHMTIKTYPLIDSVMGVDIILEDDKKRYYVHVTSNTPFAQKMLLEKENRGGYRVGKTYVRYSRDFTGDIILRYDIHTESDTTMIVNGFPLFKPEYIADRFYLAKMQSTIGEDIKLPYSKLQHFKDWAKTNLRLNMDRI